MGSEPTIVVELQRYFHQEVGLSAVVNTLRQADLYVPVRQDRSRRVVAQFSAAVGTGTWLTVFTTRERLSAAGWSMLLEVTGAELEATTLPACGEVTGLIIDRHDSHMLGLAVNPRDPMLMPMPLGSGATESEYA